MYEPITPKLEMPDTVPLTMMQRLRLLMDCLPFAFMLVVSILYLTVLTNIYGPPQPLFLAFIGLVLLVTGFTAVQRMRDFLGGVSKVEADFLNRSWRSSHGSRRQCYGEFEQLGKRVMTAQVYHKYPSSQRYWVHYGPASRIIWEMEPITDPRYTSPRA
jgi:xanthosine utilization system XapX-like protein